MSIKALQLIGLPVLAIDSGKKLDTIKDVVYDPQTNQIVALVTDEKGWFSDAKVILLEHIKNFGTDAIIVDSENSVLSAQDVPARVANISRDDNHLTKTKIVTESGKELGYVTDLFFEPDGKVVELEVSEGVLQNLSSGKKQVKISDIITVGQDVTIVRDWVKNDLDEQKEQQGLQGAASGTVDKVKEGLDTAKKTLAQTWDQVSTKVTETTQNAQLQAKLAQMETKDKMQDFQTEKLPELNQNLGSAGQKLQQNISQKSQQLGDKLQNAWEKTTSFVHEKADELGENITVSRKEAAIGKFIDVNVLDAQDNILARSGEMVTHELLNKAETAGVLDKVLNNVSKN